MTNFLLKKAGLAFDEGKVRAQRQQLHALCRESHHIAGSYFFLCNALKTMSVDPALEFGGQKKLCRMVVLAGDPSQKSTHSFSGCFHPYIILEMTRASCDSSSYIYRPKPTYVHPYE